VPFLPTWAFETCIAGDGRGEGYMGSPCSSSLLLNTGFGAGQVFFAAWLEGNAGGILGAKSTNYTLFAAYPRSRTGFRPISSSCTQIQSRH